MERLVENLPNAEAITHEVDYLPFAGAVNPVAISSPDVGDADITNIY